MTLEKQLQIHLAIDRVWRGLMLVLGVAALVGVAILAVACTPQGTGQWPPTVGFEEAHVSGSLVLATPGGLVTVDLATGLVSGSGDVEVMASDIGADVAVTVNGLRQWVAVQAPGHRDGGWVQCLRVEVAAEVSPGAYLDWASPMMCPAGPGD